MMRPDRDLLYNRPIYPPLPGNTRVEILHEDEEDNVIGYERSEGPCHCRVPGVADLDMPPMPFIGPVGGSLVFYPTVGKAKYATLLAAETGWEMAIGIGTGAELAADTTLSSEVTTYGGARASVTPTVLASVMTFAHKWSFLTGANFTLTEAGVFLDSILMMRHKYSTTKTVAPLHKITATFTSTE